MPWRFDADHYRPSDGPALHGKLVAASWDAALGAAMQKAGIVIHEESHLADLMTDLMRASHTPA